MRDHTFNITRNITGGGIARGTVLIVALTMCALLQVSAAGSAQAQNKPTINIAGIPKQVTHEPFTLTFTASSGYESSARGGFTKADLPNTYFTITNFQESGLSGRTWTATYQLKSSFILNGRQRSLPNGSRSLVFVREAAIGNSSGQNSAAVRKVVVVNVPVAPPDPPTITVAGIPEEVTHEPFTLTFTASSGYESSAQGGFTKADLPNTYFTITNFQESGSTARTWTATYQLKSGISNGRRNIALVQRAAIGNSSGQNSAAVRKVVVVNVASSPPQPPPVPAERPTITVAGMPEQVTRSSPFTLTFTASSSYESSAQGGFTADDLTFSANESASTFFDISSFRSHRSIPNTWQATYQLKSSFRTSGNRSVVFVRKAAIGNSRSQNSRPVRKTVDINAGPPPRQPVISGPVISGVAPTITIDGMPREVTSRSSFTVTFTVSTSYASSTQGGFTIEDLLPAQSIFTISNFRAHSTEANAWQADYALKDDVRNGSRRVLLVRAGATGNDSGRLSTAVEKPVLINIPGNGEFLTVSILDVPAEFEGPFRVRIKFSMDIDRSTFDVSDVTVTNASKGATLEEITALREYALEITPDGTGPVTVGFPAKGVLSASRQGGRTPNYAASDKVASIIGPRPTLSVVSADVRDNGANSKFGIRVAFDKRIDPATFTATISSYPMRTSPSQ